MAYQLAFLARLTSGASRLIGLALQFTSYTSTSAPSLGKRLAPISRLLLLLQLRDHAEILERCHVAFHFAVRG